MNLAWKERPFQELLRLAWPIAVSTVSYSVMTVVDTLLVGHLGRAALAGVGLAGISAFTLLCFSFGLLQGAKVLASQAIGANRPEKVESHLGAAVASALALGLVTIVAGQVLAIVLGKLAASEAAGAAARTYLQIRILGAPFALVYVALREIRYAKGDAKSPMRATVLAQVVNVGLAVLFVFVLKQGVRGAACATVVAHGVEAGFLSLTQNGRGFGLKLVRREHLVELFRVGLPTAIQFVLEVGAFAALSLMISLFSDVDMASHQIAIQVIHFSFLPAFAVAEAGSVLSGQAVGAASYALVLRVARLALGVTAIYTGAWSIVLALGSTQLARSFTSDPEVVSTAVRLLHIAAVFQVFDGANMVARCALRGSGDVRYAATVGVLTSWLCTPTLAWLLGYRLGLGAAGGWLGLCLEIVVGASLLWWRLEHRGWLPAAERAHASLATHVAEILPGAPSETSVVVSLALEPSSSGAKRSA